MANQKIDVIADEVVRVAYCSLRGEMLAVYDKGQEPATVPPGTVYVQEAVTVTNALVDGKPAKGFLVVEEPRTFLRGRFVTDQEEATALLMPPFVRELVRGLQGLVEVEAMVSDGTTLKVVAITMADGTEVGLRLCDKDTAPPEGVSLYPVGESPEEQAEADAKADAEWAEDFDDDEEEVDATVGICPNCLQTHALQPGIVGLTDEEAAVEQEQRELNGIRRAVQNGEYDENLDEEIPMAELVEEGPTDGRNS